jgi:hypothetical protein
MDFSSEKFRIIGLTPILFNAPTKMLQDALDPESGKPKVKKEKISPHVECELKVRRNDKGEILVPTIMFRNAILKSSAAFKQGRRSLKTYVAHIRAVPEFAVLYDGDGKPYTEFQIDSRFAKNNNMRPPAGIVVNRPRFDVWSVEIEIAYLPDFIEGDARNIFKLLLADAGVRFGAGSYRPECAGWFGQFQVDGK